MNELISGFPGLVWGFHFASDGKSVTALEGEATLPGNLPADGFVWLHLAVPDVRIEPFIKQLPGITEDLTEALVSRDRHLFLTVIDGALSGVMPDFQRELDGKAADVIRYSFAMNDRILVTTRTRPLQSMAKMRNAIAGGRWFPEPIELFAALSESFELTLEDRIDELTDSMDLIEEEVFAHRRGDHRSLLGGLRREIANIHRSLRTSARLYHRMDSRPDPNLPASYRAVLERRGHHMAALDQDVILLQERARLLHDEINTRQQDQTNHHLYILSLATVVLMPPTFITGFFGMNTKDMFLQDIPGGTVYAAMFVMAAAAAAWYALRRYGIGQYPQ